jgi:hypothetical protein
MHAFSYKTGVTASGVCALINEQRGRPNYRVCGIRGAVIANAIDSVLELVDLFRNDGHFEGSKSTVLSLPSNATLFEKLVTTLALQRAEYSGLESLPVTNISPRSNIVPTLREHVLIKGLKLGDLVFNAVHADYGNGDGHVFITPSNPISGNLQKRHDGAGFKIPHTTRVHSGLNASQRADLAGRIANSWA